MNARSRNSLAVGAAVAAAVAAGAGLTLAPAHSSPGGTVVAVDDLRDLQPLAVDPLDGAKAQLIIKAADGSTTFALRVHQIDRSAGDRTFGAHLHLGPCVSGNGDAALAHYNSDVIAGTTPRFNRSTEVWLDFTVDTNGHGRATTTVPFEVIAGERSVVIHRDPTAEVTGVAGPRLACLPVIL